MVHPLDAAGVAIYRNVEAQRSANGGLKRGVTMWGETRITPATTAGATRLDERLKPMLAKNYDDRKRFLFGESTTIAALLQPKLDGKRALCRRDSAAAAGRCLQSRGGMKYLHLDHICEEVAKVFPPDVVPDGELFIRTLYRNRATGELTADCCNGGGGGSGSGGDDSQFEALSPIEIFQFLGECVKHTSTTASTEKTNAQSRLVQYWVYDLYDLYDVCPDAESSPTAQVKHCAAARQRRLAEYARNFRPDGPLRLVETLDMPACTDADVEAAHERFVGEGYEGAMVRLYDGLYRPGVHCNELLKKKASNDDEWTVVGAKAATGGLQDGAVVWECEKNGVRVWAKQMGSVEAARQMYQKRNDYMGKLITLVYNELTSAGIPRFPRAKAFRDSSDMS